jgi:tetratricopeptide (TPR) repeat protein
MTPFQILMVIATAFFAFKIYEHVQQMEEPGGEGRRSGAPEPNPEFLVEQADNAYENGDVGQAKALLAEADVMAPDTPEILNKLAFILAKEGDDDRAVEHYERSLQIDGSDDLAHNALASLYRKRGDYDRAREHYESALAIDDAYEVTYFNYANLLVDMDEAEKAKTMYARALELKPDFMQAKFELEKLS